MFSIKEAPPEMSPYISWADSYSALNQHVLEHGHTSTAPVELQSWLGRQRALMSTGKLSADKAESLAQLPGALAERQTPKIWVTLWPGMRELLATRGLSFLDPSDPVASTHPGQLLRQVWESSGPSTDPMRALMRAVMPAITIVRPEAPTPTALAPVSFDDWDGMFDLLLSYRSEHGHLPRPHDVFDGAPLGEWAQRQQHDHHWGFLDEDRAVGLEGLADWPQPTIPGPWIRNYRALESYIRETGDSHPHPMAQYGDVRIGELMVETRNEMRDGTLDPAKARLLSVLPGWESDLPVEPTIEDRILAELFHYGMNHGHLSGATSSHKQSLGRWVSNLRRRRTDGAIDPLTSDLFAGVPGWSWSADTVRTRGMLNTAVNHLNQKGHLNTTPWTMHANAPLGAWMSEQAEQGHPNAAALGLQFEELPAPIGAIRRWDTMLNLAIHAVAAGQGAHPTTDAEAGDTPIGAWVLCARYLDGRGLLEADHSERLSEALSNHGVHWSEHFSELDWALNDDQGLEALNPAARRWIGLLNTRHAAGVRNHETEAVSGLPGWKWALNVDDQFQMDLERVRYLVFTNEIDLSMLDKGFVVDGFRLGHWVSMMRIRYARCDLPASWVGSLESTPGWTWRAGTGEPSMERWLSLLSDYWVNTGSYRVPVGHLEQRHSLGAWVRDIRVQEQMGLLDPQVRESLSALMGWEWAAA